MKRRALLALFGTVLTGLAGCISDTGRAGTESPTSTPDESNEETGLTDWERSTDCITTGERDDMDEVYDSVIQVEQVKSRLGPGYSPIKFTDLTPEEQTILLTVTEDGGYGTCDTSKAFNQFVRRVQEHKAQQEDTMVYLVRNGTYYGLYVEVTDQGFSY